MTVVGAVPRFEDVAGHVVGERLPACVADLRALLSGDSVESCGPDHHLPLVITNTFNSLRSTIT